MKTIEKQSVLSVLKFVFLTVLFLAFSCSSDVALESKENQAAANARSGNASKSVLKVIAKGAALHGANGIDIGPDGNLYVGSVNGEEIVVMDKQNGKILKRLSHEVGVMGPDDIVFGPDGSLYWTNILVGTVGRLQPDGTATEQFVALGVNPITFSPDGRLFVALDFLGDGLYELDPNLSEPPRPIIECPTGFCLGFFNAFDFGPDGRLYGPLFALGQIISMNVDDGTYTIVADGFVNPASAKFDPDGLLTVLDQTGEVFKINTQTGEKTLFIDNLDPGLDNMVFDTDGTLYMTNNDHGWVAEILPSGQSRTISNGGMIRPMGLAVLAGRNNQDALFEADIFTLRQFNGLTGRQENIYKGSLVPSGNSPSLVLPFTLSADGNNLVVSSWFSGAVQVFDPQANQVLEEYAMGAPIDAIRFKDDIVVSDLGLGGVVWASDHSMILPIDNANVFAPGGLATDGETVWMADWGTGIVWQINFDGKTAQAPTPVAFGLSFPEGLAFEKEGSLVVVETGTSSLSRIDLSTGEVIRIVDGLELSGPGLEGYPPTWGFDGVAVGQTGDIYISGGGPNVIYRVSKN